MREVIAHALTAFLIASCAGPQHAGRVTPLIAATRSGDVAEVRRLIAAGADPNEPDDNVTNWPPIIHAIHKHQLGTAAALLDSGADVNGAGPHGMTALMMAAAYGDDEGVRLLLAHRANTRLRDGNGETALDLAYSGTTDIDRFTFFRCQPSTVQLLRAAGAPGTRSTWTKLKRCA